MQLLLSRKQSPHWMGGVQFKLWARFELTEEEDALIKKYQVRNALVTLGNTRRDIRNAALYALPVPFLIYLIFHGIYGFGGLFFESATLWKAGILPAAAFCGPLPPVPRVHENLGRSGGRPDRADRHTRDPDDRAP